MFCLKWLADHGAITKDQLSEDYISYVAGNFRTIRFGIAEPHGRGEMMEFSYLLERGAVAYDQATGALCCCAGTNARRAGLTRKRIVGAGGYGRSRSHGSVVCKVRGSARASKEGV